MKREEVDTPEDFPKQAESEDEEPRGRPVKRAGEKNNAPKEVERPAVRMETVVPTTPRAAPPRSKLRKKPHRTV